MLQIHGIRIQENNVADPWGQDPGNHNVADPREPDPENHNVADPWDPDPKQFTLKLSTLAGLKVEELTKIF